MGVRGRCWFALCARSDLRVTPERYTVLSARKDEHGTPGMRKAASIGLKCYDRDIASNTPRIRARSDIVLIGSIPLSHERFAIRCCDPGHRYSG
jgi:hypothetical protein